MNRLRTIAAIPAGSWTTWVVIGSWVVDAAEPGQERIAALAGEMAS